MMLNSHCVDESRTAGRSPRTRCKMNTWSCKMLLLQVALLLLCVLSTDGAGAATNDVCGQIQKLKGEIATLEEHLGKKKAGKRRKNGRALARMRKNLDAKKKKLKDLEQAEKRKAKSEEENARKCKSEYLRELADYRASEWQQAKAEREEEYRKELFKRAFEICGGADPDDHLYFTMPLHFENDKDWETPRHGKVMAFSCLEGKFLSSVNSKNEVNTNNCKQNFNLYKSKTGVMTPDGVQKFLMRFKIPVDMATALKICKTWSKFVNDYLNIDEFHLLFDIVYWYLEENEKREKQNETRKKKRKLLTPRNLLKYLLDRKIAWGLKIGFKNESEASKQWNKLSKKERETQWKARRAKRIDYNERELKKDGDEIFTINSEDKYSHMPPEVLASVMHIGHDLDGKPLSKEAIGTAEILLKYRDSDYAQLKFAEMNAQIEKQNEECNK